MMRDKFDKLLEKKGKKLDPMEQKARGDVLSDLHGQASDAMGSKLGDLKKVAVESNSSEGLQAGLDKAKELLSNVPMDSDDNNYHAIEDSGKGYSPAGEGDHSEDEESPEEEASESPEEESHESEEGMESEHDLSPEGIDNKIQQLLALKEKLHGHK